MSSAPALPEPAHHDVDSMLSKRFGREVANYFSGSPLNRVSFLRQKHTVIASALAHPSAKFLLLNNLAPLGRDSSNLAYVSYEDFKPLLEGKDFGKSEEEMIEEYDSSVSSPLVVFLGLDEKQEDGFGYEMYKGTPYFAVDVTPKGTLEEKTLEVIEEVKAKGRIFIEGRVAHVLNASEAAIYAQARSLIDWNIRNPFCAGCGHSALSVNFGTKRVCPPTDNASPSSKTRPPCPTRQGITNLSFPRTDPTVIMAVLSQTSTHLLLGRQSRWPPNFYSVLAGFCEPAESVEEAVRREVWEQTGVKIGRVVVHSTQPWPYPANLMIGAVAQAVRGGEEISLEHDKEELEDARWVEVEEIERMLRGAEKGLDQVLAGDMEKKEEEGVGMRLPPKTTISHQLLKAVVEGFGR